MSSMRKSIAAAAITIASGLGLSGCATEKYVDEHIAVVSQRIDALDAKVAQVDQTAQAAAQAAQTAGAAAQSANQRIDQLTGTFDSLRTKNGFEASAALKAPRGTSGILFCELPVWRETSEVKLVMDVGKAAGLVLAAAVFSLAAPATAQRVDRAPIRIAPLRPTRRASRPMSPHGNRPMPPPPRRLRLKRSPKQFSRSRMDKIVGRQQRFALHGGGQS